VVWTQGTPPRRQGCGRDREDYAHARSPRPPATLSPSPRRSPAGRSSAR
jgi:hypothetical protein